VKKFQKIPRRDKGSEETKTWQKVRRYKRVTKAYKIPNMWQKVRRYQDM